MEITPLLPKNNNIQRNCGSFVIGEEHAISVRVFHNTQWISFEKKNNNIWFAQIVRLCGSKIKLRSVLTTRVIFARSSVELEVRHKHHKEIEIS